MQENFLRSGAAPAKKPASISESAIAFSTGLAVPSPVAAQIEFATVSNAVILFGLGKSTLYALEKQVPRLMVRVRKRGNATGRTLVDCARLRGYLAQCGDVGQAVADEDGGNGNV